MWERFTTWIEANEGLVGAAVVVSVVTFVGSLALLPILVARIPTDYFAARKPPPSPWREHHPWVRGLILALKNALGLALLLAGIAMLLLPGQGILTVLVAIALLNFPGKRALELSLMRRRTVFRAMNWIREKAGRRMLLPPPPRRR